MLLGLRAVPLVVVPGALVAELNDPTRLVCALLVRITENTEIHDPLGRVDQDRTHADDA